MMKGKPLLVLAVVSLTGMPFAAHGLPDQTRPEQAMGRWSTPSRHGVVEIAACGSSICGRLMESDHIRTNPAYPDSANRDPALRSRALKGLTILQGFRRDGEGWSGGTIYNPEDGGTYKATVTLADANTLKLKGCIVWPLCKTQTWKRIP